MMVVLVSTADPGSRSSRPTGSSGDTTDAIPASPGGSVTEALAGLVTATYDRARAVGYRGGRAFPVLGEPGELDVELVERLIGHDGIGYTADAADAVAQVDDGATSTAPFCFARPGSRTSSSALGAAR